jgi:hypothetical protein
MTDDTHSPPRRRGRPRRSDGPAFPTEEVDRLLVHGEMSPEGRLTYPSYRDIGKRFGVAHSLVADYARSHDCLGRREQIARKIRKSVDEKLAEQRAEAIAVTEADLLRAIDRYFVNFEEALREGRVRCDSITDFNQMCRLRAFLLGEPDTRHEVVRGVSAEELRSRYTRTHEVEAEIATNPALAGLTQ